MPMRKKTHLVTGTPDFPRFINEKKGATRRSSEYLLKSERPRDPTEAFGEACLARAWEVVPRVVRMHLHILPLTYEYEGVCRKTYPDGQAWLKDGSTIIREVKPSKVRHDAVLQSRYAAIARKCALDDVDFKLVYGDDLMRLPRRHNIDLLLRARESPPPEEKALTAAELIRDRRRITIGDLRAKLALSYLEVLSLVSADICHIDLNLNFNDSTELHADDLGEFDIYL